MLDDRKKRILQAIIDDYVSTAEPIGSRTIAKKYEIGLSSATIRNEMADLEELGYLHQPHTSAGRVPSDKGYRLYVDELMTRKELSECEIEVVKNCLMSKITAIEQIMKQACSILSQLTHYTTIAAMTSIKKNVIKGIQMIPLDNNNVVLIIVSGTGIIKNNIIKLPENIGSDFILKFSKILNDKLFGLTLESITLPLIQDIQKEMGTNRDILMPVLDILTTSISDIEDSDIFIEGTKNIFDYPEYNSIEKAKEFINTVEEKNTMHKILECSNDESIKISIGKENCIDEMDDCSLIATSYSIGDKQLGKIGIIGPKRMNYSKAVSSINIVRKHLYDIFEDWLYR